MEFKLRVGNLPALLEATLGLTHASGILGTEFLLNSIVTISLPDQIMLLQRP